MPDPTAAADALPRKLQRSARGVELLETSKVERLVASKQTGDVSRESLAALYGLAARLHSTQIPFHAKTLETSRARHVTTEQIWGQMDVLLRPVLRRLQDLVRTAEKNFGSGSGATASSAKLHKSATKSSVEDAGGADGAASGEDTSELAESDMDEEIQELLREQARRRRAKAAPRGGADKGDQDREGKGDDWRYAFGKGGADEDDWGDEADDADRGKRDDEEDEDEDDEEEDRANALRVRNRNARAMDATGDEEGEEDMDDDAAAAEELAALRELYGEDYEDDGEGFLGDEEDAGMQDDIELDDPNYQGDEGLYDERDGQFWGKDDILNDEAGMFDDGRADPTQMGNHAEGGEEEDDYDEEFEKALQDPSLTELERERMREKRHIEKMEQKRLYGTDWSMAGETSANKRPREALLDVDDLDFEHGMKSVPVITEAFTAKLEDRIKKRIVDRIFDDVERRRTLSSADDLVTTKRDAALDSEKSKLSLMDLYEKEYLEKMRIAEEASGDAAATAEPLSEIEKDELRAVQMWKRLSQHLDALSNFFYTPKPVQQDLEARVRATEHQAPAISVETVGHFATTRASAMAPQDLYRGSARKFADVGVDELRPQERRALRRSKKDDGAKAKERKETRKQQSSKTKVARNAV